MIVDKYNIIEYIRNLDFNEAYDFLMTLAYEINNKTANQNSHYQKSIITEELLKFNPYKVKVSLEDISHNVNFGEFLYEQLIENPKQSEQNFANSLEWHSRIQYDKFHKFVNKKEKENA